MLICSESSSAVDDEQQSTVRLLADARCMAYVKGRWVYTDTGCEQLYRIVSPTLPGNGDYSVARTIVFFLYFKSSILLLQMYACRFYRTVHVFLIAEVYALLEKMMCDCLCGV